MRKPKNRDRNNAATRALRDKFEGPFSVRSGIGNPINLITAGWVISGEVLKSRKGLMIMAGSPEHA